MAIDRTAVAIGRCLAVAVVLCIGDAASADAAQSQHRLVIVVRDGSDAVIPGVAVRVIEVGTKQSKEAVSDTEGRVIVEVRPRLAYEIHAELDGFEQATRVVQTTDQAEETITLRLQPRAVDEQVNVAVNATGLSVAADRNADAVEFDSEELLELPTDGQDLLSVVESFVDPAAARGNGLSIVVDGVDGSNLGIPASAIRRLALNRNPYSSQFRYAGKARAEIVTLHGSRNYFHGGAAYHVRNGALDARNAYAAERSELDRRLFESSFNGPLPGPGTSFFISGERLVDNGTAFVNAETLSGRVVTSAPTTESTNEVLTRFDLRRGRGGAQELSVRYAFSDTSETNRGVGSLRLPSQGFASAEREHQFRVSTHDVVTSNVIHDFAIDVRRGHEGAGTVPTSASIEVLGAFVDGPAQVFEDARKTSIQLQDMIVVSHKLHTLRFGGKVRRSDARVTDATGFGGTFEFSGLEQFAARQPMLFRITRGNPTATFNSVDASAFIEDTITRGTVSASLGLRYDWETWVPDRNNVAPRVSIALAPGAQRTVIRAGAGVFYDSLPDAAIARSVMFAGGEMEHVVVQHPLYPSGEPGSGPASSTRRTLRLAEALSSPRVVQANVALERELWRRTNVTVDYTIVRGTGLLRSRDVNAPQRTGTRPDPGAGSVVEIESSGMLRAHATSLTFRGRVKEFKGTAQYTWSRSRDSADDLFAMPADGSDLDSEFGPAVYDRRHRVSLAGTLGLPYGWRLGVRGQWLSGTPFTITTGEDDNADGFTTDRPAGVTRNTERGPGSAQADVRLTKLLRLPKFFAEREGDELDDNFDLNLDVFNVLNRVNRLSPIGVLSSPLFGQSIAARPARTLQLSARYRF